MCLALLGRGDVLWWTVSKDATVDETSSLYTFLSTKPYSPFNEDNWDEPYTEYLAQVVVVNYSGETLATLPVGWATGETNPYSGNPMVDFDPDITLVEIGHPSAGYVGAEWSASKVSHELVEEYLFQVQILQDSSGEENLICFSDFARGADLDYEHIYTEGTLDSSLASTRTYDVPSPSAWIWYTCIEEEEWKLLSSTSRKAKKPRSRPGSTRSRTTRTP